MNSVKFGSILFLGIGNRGKGLDCDGPPGGLGVLFEEVFDSLGVVHILLGKLDVLRVAHVESDRHRAFRALSLFDDRARSFREGIDVAFGCVPSDRGNPLGDYVQGCHQDAEEGDSVEGLPASKGFHDRDRESRKGFRPSCSEERCL